MRKPALALVVALCAPFAAAQVKNPDTFTFVSISDADTLDPAYAYDSFSHHLQLNVYDTLVGYEGSSVDKFSPRAAEKVPSKANRLISADGKTYTFPIRKGMKFHDGTPVTPDDVRYSLMRFMLQDRNAGPAWILLQPLTGEHSTRDDKGNFLPGVYKKVADAVTVKGDSVVIKLPKPYAPMMSILASWGAIVSRKWATEKGDWNGEEATWQKHNNPQKQQTPFFEDAMGSGPFKLERWDRRTKQVVLLRNDDYWKGPAKLKRVVIKGVNEFGTRKLMLQAGDADVIYALQHEKNQLAGIPGVKILDDLPIVELAPIVFFTFKINQTGNPHIGSGKLDGDGIPADFFADKDVRKGFAYSFDYEGFVRDVHRGKATQATGAIPVSLPGHNAKQPKYKLDLAKAKEHFQKAMGGSVWEKGFRFNLLYNSGNTERETLCQMLKRSVESINPKFKIDVRPVEWPAFLDAYKASKLPIFVIGWAADFPDPHNFAYPLLHSRGDYPWTQKYSNPAIDKLIDQAIAETDPAKRKALYHKIIALEYDDVPHLVLVDRTRFRAQRDWAHGYVHSPVFPDAPYGAYYYTIWKGTSEGGKGAR